MLIWGVKYLPANMIDKLQEYIARIREIKPGIRIESAILNDGGLVNDVVVINQETVFRFAKSEEGVRQLEAEVHVLRAITPHASLPVPMPFYTSRDAIAYPYLPGEALTRAVLSQLNGSERQAAADQLALFLKEMHHAPVDETIPATLAPVRYADWTVIRSRVEEEIYPLLMEHQRIWVENLFDDILGDENNFAYKPGLIHGDLGCYHILFDPASKRLSGIIDFGVAGIGDPANDLACLIQYYGEAFVSGLKNVYHDIDARMMKRARFYARALELQWILNGLHRGEAFWFAAHIGNARDIIQPGFY